MNDGNPLPLKPEDYGSYLDMAIDVAYKGNRTLSGDEWDRARRELSRISRHYQTCLEALAEVRGLGEAMVEITPSLWGNCKLEDVLP